MPDPQSWTEFFDSGFIWLVVGVMAFGAVFGSWEFKTWRNRNRRRTYDSGFYFDNGVEDDMWGDSWGDGDGGDGGGGDGGGE